MKKINEILTIKELSSEIQIPLKTIYKYLNTKDMSIFYTSFYIPKKDGGQRKILSPQPELKFIQRKINNIIYNSHYINEDSNNCVQAFVKKRSIISNAKIHRHKKYILKIDIHAFFDNINFGRVLHYFRKNKNFLLSKEVSFALAKIACCNNRLPQGSPLSPIISNLIGEIIDYRIKKITEKYRCEYTRYADDMIFSTNDDKILNYKKKFISEVYTTIRNSGFNPNIKKTNIKFFNSRQTVTGIVVNQNLGIAKEYRKKLRAMCYSYFKTGTYVLNGNTGTIDELLGMLSFVNQIDKSNNKELIKIRTNRMTKRLENPRNNHTLNNRERLYRDFLFFTKFYNNQQPILITEGKTDNLYLKAAIMKSIINPAEFSRQKGFSMNYKSLNYSSIYSYLFGGSENGASKVPSIYYYFNDKNNNIEKRFDKNKYIKSDKPIIFLLDNEKQSDKPLQQFIKIFKMPKVQEEELTNNFYTKLKTNGKNIYLIIIPKEDEKDCEIEDLFDSKTLNIKINGRSFSRKDENPKLYYNKNIFSRYILKKFQYINFSKFKKLLDIIENICSHYS